MAWWRISPCTATGESVGTSAAADGVQAVSIAENCRGIANAGVGVLGVQVSNSFGTSTTGTGLSATHANNCQGFSNSATGLNATTALSSVGRSSSGTGLVATGAATFCRGEQNAGTAISAAIAIGCTAVGTVSSPSKFLGTP